MIMMIWSQMMKIENRFLEGEIKLKQQPYTTNQVTYIGLKYQPFYIDEGEIVLITFESELKDLIHRGTRCYIIISEATLDPDGCIFSNTEIWSINYIDNTYTYLDTEVDIEDLDIYNDDYYREVTDKLFNDASDELQLHIDKMYGRR